MMQEEQYLADLSSQGSQVATNADRRKKSLFASKYSSKSSSNRASQAKKMQSQYTANLSTVQKTKVYEKLDVLNEFTQNLIAEFFISLPYREPDLIKTLIAKVRPRSPPFS